jgi:exodeoxyribonuclease VII large subunit
MEITNTDKPQRRIYTVSELTADIKKLLEERFPLVWVSGEISNFRMPASGHFYFTLKDEKAQINAVMFRGQARNLKFDPEDGISVSGLGRISLYEPRGTYQIIFEYLEPEGIGAIQLAFEQLKERLYDEGLFHDKHKKPLPFLPKKISIITSPSGAVVHDILNIINRRFANVHLEIIPVKVQGDNADAEIVSAVEILNTQGDSDVAILARGGGSLEDFQAFNAETVARAIFASQIPIISAVGHETDFTIADFVADLRASTPSAAAELVVPIKNDLERRCAELSMGLTTRCFRYIENLRVAVKEMSDRLTEPKKKIEDFRLRIDDLAHRCARTFHNSITLWRERLDWRMDRLFVNNPSFHSEKLKNKLKQNDNNLFINLRICLEQKHALLRELNARLQALSPAAVLSRGYSITRTIPDAAVVIDPNDVTIGQDLDVTVAKGSLICRVKRK